MPPTCDAGHRYDISLVVEVVFVTNSRKRYFLLRAAQIDMNFDIATTLLLCFMYVNKKNT